MEGKKISKKARLRWMAYLNRIKYTFLPIHGEVNERFCGHATCCIAGTKIEDGGRGIKSDSILHNLIHKKDNGDAFKKKKDFKKDKKIQR